MRPAHEPLFTSELRAASGTDARWLGRRARNVARRPLLLALFTSAGFLAALLVVILVPHDAPPAPARHPARRDSVAVLTRIAELRGRLTQVDTAFAAARMALDHDREVPSLVDTFPMEVRSRRNALVGRVRALAASAQRAGDAPLPASYRSLAAEPELSSDSMVRTLMLALDSIEAARAQSEATGAADTAFMAITARAASIGDSLIDIAERRLRRMRRELASMIPEPSGSAPATPVDTLPLIASRDSVIAELERAEANLAIVRRHNDSLAAIERNTAAANPQTAADPKMLIAAAGVSGLAVGFLVALIGEIRRPAVADSREAEVAGALPVLAHISEIPNTGLRARRSSDRDVAQVIELTSDRYDRLYHRLADSLARLPQVAVLGDEPTVVAAVAANLAAAAARTARSTLLLDTDFETAMVSRVLRLRRHPGMTDVLEKRHHWSSVIAQAVVGRDRIIDVLPAGRQVPAGGSSSDPRNLGKEIAHIVGRYDTVVVSAPVAQRGAVTALAAAVPDTIICVRLSHTPIRLLQRMIDEVRADGARLRGLVLWSRVLDERG